ncbi:hypothetical protein O3P69_007190 [Scylla paramamosain]|uniref:Uncharacterized protein n=1 Tax=Scylla paramamosain TaxID=85552 RepID=A0AAW0V2Z7_SCYPA
MPRELLSGNVYTEDEKGLSRIWMWVRDMDRELGPHCQTHADPPAPDTHSECPTNSRRPLSPLRVMLLPAQRPTLPFNSA